MKGRIGKVGTRKPVRSKTRRALLVGIDDYSSAPLSGCVADAARMDELLKRHENGDPNFDCKLLTSPPCNFTKADLRGHLHQLLDQPAQMALFYFAGHGMNVDRLGGYLVTKDFSKFDLGVSMADILTMINNSPVEEVVVILDCCDSGAFGQTLLNGIDTTTIIRNGVSILTSSGPHEPSSEEAGRGVFTNLVCDALAGGASDIRGEVNAASIYSYCDQILGPWDQRPRFKSNVAGLTELRMCNPQVEFPILRLLCEYFPTAEHEYDLDPSYEPDKRILPEEDTEINQEHEKIFSNLQRFRAARLLEPVGAQHMFYAAVNRKSCRLTPLGKFYWKMVKVGRI